MKLLYFLLLLITSCASDTGSSTKDPWQEIAGRDVSYSPRIERFPLYRARIPLQWKRIDPQPRESIADTTLPLATFVYEDLTVTIHNFPTDSLEERVPPLSHVLRWKKQLTQVSPQDTRVSPFHRAGFVGYSFEVTGLFKGAQKTVYAWALTLDPDHYQSLQLPGTMDEKNYYKQMRADVTIKAVGKPATVEQQREAILQLVHSFELIQEIPAS